MKKTKYVNDWLDRANEDFDAAQILLKGGGPANVICFHAQQVAEKYLKGYLAAHKKHIRKIHQLDVLLVACEEIDSSFEIMRDIIFFLNTFYVEARYPGDMPEFGLRQARSALESADAVKKFVNDKIDA